MPCIKLKAYVTLMLLDAQVGALCFLSLQIRFKDDCAIPAGCDPEPVLAPFVDVGLPFFAVYNGEEFPPGDAERSTSRSLTAGQFRGR